MDRYGGDYSQRLLGEKENVGIMHAGATRDTYPLSLRSKKP